jgi:hypothetical protein
MGKVRLRYRVKRREYSSANETERETVMGEHDAKRWGTAAIRLHSNTLQMT